MALIYPPRREAFSPAVIWERMLLEGYRAGAERTRRYLSVYMVFGEHNTVIKSIFSDRVDR